MTRREAFALAFPTLALAFPTLALAFPTLALASAGAFAYATRPGAHWLGAYLGVLCGFLALHFLLALDREERKR